MKNHKKWGWTLCLSLFAAFANGQRFLTPIFDAIAITTDISYGNASNYLGEPEDLRLDFYEPVSDTMALRPMVIYVHGGGFVDTTQSKSLVHIVAYCDSLARRGYVTASINYRLDTSISNRAVINAMHDAKAAVRFFKANYLTYKIDTNLMFIGGESAGAITSLATNYIDLPGETNHPPTLPLSSDLTLEGDSGNPGHTSQTKGTLCFCGGTKTVLEEQLFDTLAIQNASNPNLLMVHGTADPLIPTVRALEIAIRAENVGLPYLFYTMPGATHCPWFYSLENSWEYLDTLISYTVPFLYACVVESSGLNEVLGEKSVSIYPNPASDFIRIQFKSFEAQQMVVYNLLGELVFDQLVSSGFELGIVNWSRGVYVIKMPDLELETKLIIE